MIKFTAALLGAITAIFFMGASSNIPKLPPGSMISTASTTCPTGTLYANGSAINRVGTYGNLFAAISTTYGVGNGSTTFNIPDARGVFIRGEGSQTISGTVYAGTQGTSQRDQIQGHYHNKTDPGHSHFFDTSSSNSGSLTYPVITGGNTVFASRYTGAVPNATTGLTITAPTDDGTNGTPRTGTETRPANIVLKQCIYY